LLRDLSIRLNAGNKKGAAAVHQQAAPKFQRVVDAPEKQFDTTKNNSDVNP
jgi:hypothetical protein